MHQDYIRKHQILYRSDTAEMYLVLEAPKAGPVTLIDSRGYTNRIEPYLLRDYGIQSEPLLFEDVQPGQKLVSFEGDIYEVRTVCTSISQVGRQVILTDSHGHDHSKGADGIGKYRIHTPTPTKEEPMRFNVPTTAATSFSTINPADAVVLDAAPAGSVPGRITELGENDEVTPSRLLLTLPAEVVQALAHAELARNTVFAGDCTLDAIATDRLERILPRLVGLLTEVGAPKRE